MKREKERKNRKNSGSGARWGLGVEALSAKDASVFGWGKGPKGSWFLLFLLLLFSLFPIFLSGFGIGLLSVLGLGFWG